MVAFARFRVILMVDIQSYEGDYYISLRHAPLGYVPSICQRLSHPMATFGLRASERVPMKQRTSSLRTSLQAAICWLTVISWCRPSIVPEHMVDRANALIPQLTDRKGNGTSAAAEIVSLFRESGAIDLVRALLGINQVYYDHEYGQSAVKHPGYLVEGGMSGPI